MEIYTTVVTIWMAGSRIFFPIYRYPPVSCSCALNSSITLLSSTVTSPKPFKHGYLFFAKFKTFLLKRLNATPDGIRLGAFFTLPRIGQRLQSLKNYRRSRAGGNHQ